MERLSQQRLIAGLCFICGSLLLLIATTSDPIAIRNVRSQFAQIVQIQIEVLRNWQQHGRLNRDLAYGSRGSDIVLLQKMLAQDATNYPSKRVTGRYGELTQKAVRGFQADYGLPVTGMVDDATRAKLNDIFFSELCPQPRTIYPDMLYKKMSGESFLPPDYVPPGLEDISKKVPTAGVMCLREDVVPYLVQMFTDARNAGVDLMVSSGFRRPEIQKYLYELRVRTDGELASREIARPGLSEHQLGGTVDLTDASIGYEGAARGFAESLGGIWLEQNAHKYGFTLSYPARVSETTGIQYEPWHWRFVGVDMATSLKARGTTFNEQPDAMGDLRNLTAIRPNAAP
ncbi:hypothetical protein A3D71_01105 [Candidatus Kaiserbacteria bacterium RIFCSPHIGHO2_02_FULL_55_20]|uniref:Peptidase M15B domain-containing protein n=1 Tax=Candidatus Kaiserbacteria bacterium RIFCSPHIGHO2_02_FULL_55_20 TaxID=1798497 RepID=A0A1F6DVM8_9BACT|nr:MAG: hypothetical protein A2680_02630 [Candidatus Kaiserbacteria bacterium RIFCSPHIGHO2_01_FULL_55_37]OGG65499.1 MAG: hypothetical protein A3D71_01105 [Candidatus Kaiserbacteria bacterium RIFCSPHIGHO2_02_FULL_55_20]